MSFEPRKDEFPRQPTGWSASHEPPAQETTGREPPDYRIVLPEQLFSTAFERLQSGEQPFAWGRVHRSYHRRRITCDLSVRQMRFRRQPPTGDRFSPVEDWLLMAVLPKLDPAAIERLITRSERKPGQTLVILVLGIESDRGKWVAAIVQRNEVLPVAEVRLIGCGMPVFTRQPGAPRVDSSHSFRWSRIDGALGPVSQRFRQSRVFLIGAGRLGSLLAEVWIRAGLMDLTVVDQDRIEAHNLDLTFGTTEADIGQPKVFSLLRYLTSIHSAARLRGFCRPIEDASIWDTAREAELIVSCVDNNESRLLASRMATRLLKVHLDVGTLVRRPDSLSRGETGESAELISNPSRDTDRLISADIRLLLPGTCVRCVGGIRDDNRDDSETTNDSSADFSETPPSLTGPEASVAWRQGGRAGSLPSINLQAVGTAWQLWLDLLGGYIDQAFWQRIRWSQGTGLLTRGGPVTRQQDCENCGPVIVDRSVR